MTAPAQPPSGWYPNPQGAGQRYWDGTRWTDAFQAPPPPPRKRHVGRILLLVLIVVVAAIIARSALGGGGTDESVSVQTGTVGQVITTKSDWSYRVTDVWTTRRVGRGSRGARRYRQAYPAIARGRFVVVALRSRWRGDFEVDSGAQPAVLLAGDGKVYAERQTLARDFDRPYQAAEFDPNDVGGWGRDFTLEPGGTRSGVLVFEVPTRAVRGSRLELEPELGELVRIDLGI